MFCIKIRETDIYISFSFFMVVSLVCLWNNGNSVKVLIMLCCCVLHEMGHISAMCLTGSKPLAVTLYGGGIKITPDTQRIKSTAADVIILLSGCGVNFLLALVSVLICGRLTFFTEANIMLGVFNILPFGYFDGGRVLEIIAGEGSILKILRTVFLLLCILAVVFAALDGTVSASLFAVIIYIVLSEIISRR